MSWDYVKVEKRGPIALVRFDRKENLNAFNQKLILEMTEVARSFHDDVETQAIVVAGAAEAFSAGADLKDPESWKTAEMNDVERRRRFYRGVRLCEAWEQTPQITIAAIERMAVGAGIALGLALDWRVMGEKAFLYVPEVKIGLNLQWGALPRLITLVGPARAKRICLLCERMGAQQALDWGIVDEVAPDGKTVDKALELAETVATMPHATVRIVKEAVNATAGALHKAASYADADQSQLTAGFADAATARDGFTKG